MSQIILKDYLHLSTKEHKKLLKIRNKDYIRAVSLDKNIIDFDNHMSFIENLKNSDMFFLAVIFDDEIIGGINVFNLKSDTKWGVFFLEEANIIIKSIVPLYFLEYIFKKYKKSEIFLDVKKKNINSISYDKNLGFEIYKEEDKIISMKINYEKFKKAKDKPFLKRVVKQMKKYDLEIV